MTKTSSIPITYQFRTKFAQSGDLEKSSRRERVFGPGRCVAVRRFACVGPWLWWISAGSGQRRMLDGDGLAEGEGFELSIRVMEQLIRKVWFPYQSLSGRLSVVIQHC